MKKISCTLLALSLCTLLPAQESFGRILQEITQHNTTLSATRQRIKAEKLSHYTGIFPQNPELEFNYLWGQPAAMGNRQDFTVKQSFEFPTVYLHKSKVAGFKSEQSNLEYQIQLSDIRYQATQLCLQLTFQNAITAELRRRQHYAEEIAQAYERKLTMGQAGRLELNKAQVFLMTVSKRLEMAIREREVLMAELIRLNGGNQLLFNDSTFASADLPLDFDDWFAALSGNIPELLWVERELSVASAELRLAKAQQLPGFFAGYMSETVVGQQFRGITMGMTIPLWEQKNTVRQARAKSEAVRFHADDRMMWYRSELKSLFDKALSLEKSIADFRLKLQAYSNNDLLKIAFDYGELSLSELMMELSAYHESYTLLLELELELGLTVALMQRTAAVW